MALVSCLAACRPGGLGFDDPWVRAMPPASGVTAGYVRLHNRSPFPITLCSVSSSAFARISLHRTELRQGQVAMRPQARLTLQPGERAALEPGGLHLMLEQPTQALAPGTELLFTVTSCDGKSWPVMAEVRAS